MVCGFWPRSGEKGTPEQPVVLLEVQMHSKPGFKHRLGAQSFRFLQIHPQVLHLAVVVVVPHRRLKLGPAQLPSQLQAFVDGVIWLSLERMSRQSDLDPLLNLLTLPVRPLAFRQQQRDQIRGALEQPIEPVIGFQTPASDTGQPSSANQLTVLAYYLPSHP